VVRLRDTARARRCDALVEQSRLAVTDASRERSLIECPMRSCALFLGACVVALTACGDGTNAPSSTHPQTDGSGPQGAADVCQGPTKTIVASAVRASAGPRIRIVYPADGSNRPCELLLRRHRDGRLSVEAAVADPAEQISNLVSWCAQARIDGKSAAEVRAHQYARPDPLTRRQISAGFRERPCHSVPLIEDGGSKG
jgi:hypothetical protein